ncbi:MAG: AAA family ATPase [Rhizobiaceae bacterium]|nr:AAA family ATPase [Rhizobiaceae bacterium]
MDQNRQLLESFLPLQLLGRLHAIDGERPVAIKFSAAVLFIDVSRFTSLVEQLARRGHGGLEAVPRLLGMAYSRCAEQVGARGGEVANFAGDSLLAYWPVDTFGVADAVRSASECADAICREHWERLTDHDENEPALHFGIGVGEIWAAAVGGEPTWNLIVGGEAVADGARALAGARSWEFVISDHAQQLLHDAAEVEQEVPGDPPPTSAPTAWLAEFLPPLLQEIVADEGDEAGLMPSPVDARLDALSEIRPISTLLARVSGLDPTEGNSLRRHHLLCASMQGILRDLGGPAGELMFDDKGLIFVAAFGMRGTFHRDDPKRAIEAARAIRQAALDFGLDVSVGIATGDTFVRVVGSPRRRQLMILGPPVNRAARLMTSVVNEIVCDAPTERAARSAYRFESRGTLRLEGLGDMAPIYSPLAPATVALPASMLIGRTREIAVLKRAHAEMAAGHNRLVIVQGEPGIGKTALANAFAEDLRQEGLPVFISKAERDNRRTSLLGWRRVLESLVDLPHDSDANEVFERISGRTAHWPAITERLGLLGDVLSIENLQSEGTRHLTGAHRADATMRLLGEIIEALAPRPMTLVLEDSQWLDSASWRLVEWILGSFSPLMIVLCVRAGEVPEELRSLQQRARALWTNAESDEGHIRVVELTEMGNAAISELVVRTIGGVPPHDEIIRRVATLAGGNPFFAEEIALTLKDEGLIAERDGQWRSIRPLDDLKHFEGVERVIRERVDRLSAPAQDVLRSAAVIGRSFTGEALGALCGGIAGNSLEVLCEARLVRRETGTDGYEFRHDQIRDVVYNSIPGDVRTRLHSTFASWIEANHSEAMGAEIAALVQHHEAGGNHDKAVQFADVAARSALEIGAFREVEAFIDICLAHEPPRQSWSQDQELRSVRWRRQLAEAHYSRGDIHAQGVAVRHALDVAGRPVPYGEPATLASLLARSIRLTLQQAFPPASVPDGPGQPENWDCELARCLSQAAMVDYFELRFTRGMCNLVGAAIHAERTGVSVELAIASSQLACGLGIMGWTRASDHFMRRAENVAIALGDPALHSHVCNLDALWRLGRADWVMVDQRLDQSQSLSLKAGDQLRWCNAQGMRFWSQYYRGDQDAWEPTSLALLSHAQNAGNIQQEIWALRCKALCLLHTDRPREAIDILRLITSAMPGSVDLAARISAMGALALALSRIGNTAQSIDAVGETLRLLREMRRPSSHSILVGIAGALEVLVRGREVGLLQRYEHWQDWEHEALTELKRYVGVFPVGIAQLGMWAGASQWLNGSKDEALASWQKATTDARSFHLRKDESMIAAEIRRRKDRA